MRDMSYDQVLEAIREAFANRTEPPTPDDVSVVNDWLRQSGLDGWEAVWVGSEEPWVHPFRPDTRRRGIAIRRCEEGSTA